MTTWYIEEESANAYPPPTWREAFYSLEPVVGRSVSEVIVEDLRKSRVDVSEVDVYVKIFNVASALSWLFGDGSEFLL